MVCHALVECVASRLGRTEAREVLAGSFPNEYHKIPTSGKGLLCSLKAPAGSITEQYPFPTVVTILFFSLCREHPS
ncbi:hypothetical protein VTI74DRAFT_9575 [Chaetomium olivicolor]